MSKGWIKLYRQISDHEIWREKPFTRGQAWVDLLLMANHAEDVFWVRGVKVEVKRGQVGRSELSLADKWGWSRGKITRFLRWLENERQIVQQKSAVTSIITILNYDQYQQSEQQIEQQTDNRRTTDGQQTDINKNVKKNKNEKKNRYCFQKPSIQEIADYSRLIGFHCLDPQQFFDHYESKGWLIGRSPMKNWQAAIRTWKKRSLENGFAGKNKLQPIAEQKSAYGQTVSD